MSPRKPVPEEEIGPLGLGEAPAKDPLKQFGGMVVASSLTLELITFVLALPMLYKLYDGTLWTPFNLSLIHISEPTRLRQLSRMPSSA